MKKPCETRAFLLAYRYNLAKMKAGQSAASTALGPDHEATCKRGATMAYQAIYPDSGMKCNSEPSGNVGGNP